ncbi:hypothetical protein KKF61_05725 [Patescibacteria group bacterium]|nr:hypothetical protein [Patescibacteria group bacterium]
MKKLAFVLGLAIAIFVSAQIASAAQIIDDALQVNSLKVGQQGAGGVTYFNGTIVNETTGDDGANNPVTFGDNVRIDGRIYRGATAGTTDSLSLIVNDNMEVEGSLTVGSTNVLDAINGITTISQSDLDNYMLMSTYDAAANGLVDADKLDSGIAATLVGAGTVGNTEFGFLNGVTSGIQTQLDVKQEAGGAITGDGTTTQSGMLSVVTNDSNGKTLTISEVGTIQTNAGATSGGIWNLPDASSVIGAHFTFAVVAAQNLDINPRNGDQILAGTNNSGDAVRGNDIGSMITLVSLNGSSWAASGGSGSWDDVN